MFCSLRKLIDLPTTALEIVLTAAATQENVSTLEGIYEPYVGIVFFEGLKLKLGLIYFTREERAFVYLHGFKSSFASACVLDRELIEGSLLEAKLKIVCRSVGFVLKEDILLMMRYIGGERYFELLGSVNRDASDWLEYDGIMNRIKAMSVVYY